MFNNNLVDDHVIYVYMSGFILSRDNIGKASTLHKILFCEPSGDGFRIWSIIMLTNMLMSVQFIQSFNEHKSLMTRKYEINEDAMFMKRSMNVIIKN